MTPRNENARLPTSLQGQSRSNFHQARRKLALGDLAAGQTYTLLITLESGRLEPDDRITAELSGAETDKFVKELHAGDCDFYLPYRPARDGQCS